jgi:hypothetical protein
MRGDVWYVLGTLYCVIGDGERHLICCKNAIETQVKDIFTYCENNLYSNVFPAMDLYINSDDQSIKDSMIEHLKKYSNLKEVQDFFKENKIKFHK